MIFCTACGSEADEQALFCDQCGDQLVAALPLVCSECGRRNRATAHFCSACGMSLALAVTTTPIKPPASVQVPPPVEGPTPAVTSPPRPAELPSASPPPEFGQDAPPELGEDVDREGIAREETPTPAAALAQPAGRGPAAAIPTAPVTEPPTGVRRDAEGTREPPPPPGPSLAEGAREWAASRQADILLYLGAFLLVAAALLFVSSQGEELSPGLRVGLLLVYTFAFVIAGIAAQRSDRIREAGMVFLAIGALITPLNFVLIYTEVLEDRDVSRSVVWLLGSIYSALFYALLWQRGYGRLYAVPAGLATISGWAALAAVTDLPRQWLGTWWVLFLVGVSLITDRIGRYELNAAWTLGVFIGLAFSAQVLGSDLFDGDDGQVPLAVSLGLITGWFALTGASLRAPTLLPWGATVAIATAVAAMRAAGLEADWWAYPALAMGLAAVFTRPWWSPWHLGVSRAGWLYAAACGSSPLVLIPVDDDGANGAVSFFLGAAVLASIAWRDRSDGFQFFEPASAGTPTELWERVSFAWVGFVLALIGVAFAQRESGMAAPNLGWSYLAISVVTMVLFAQVGRRWDPATSVFVPPALLAMSVSLQDPDLYPGHVGLNLGVTAAAFIAGFAVTRRWSLTLIGALLAIFSAAAAWDALSWSAWTLAATYSGTGVALFAALTRLRTYRLLLPRGVSGQRLIVASLSWGLVVLGPLVAFAQILPIEIGTEPQVIESVEYRTGLYLTLLIAPLLLYEGWRFNNWNVTAGATTLAAIIVAPLWSSYGWPGWTLALVYLGVGVLRFATMTTVRNYEREIRQIPIIFLSWGLTLAAPVTVWISLAERMASEGGSAVETVEYRTLIAVVLAHVPLLLFEARRLRARWALVTASVVAMTALLLTIAAFRFDEVQAYTAPVGLFWIAFGLVVRRSEAVIGRHLMLHELVLLGGATILLTPQVGKGLQPDGAAWGSVVLLEGVVFLLIGLVLGSRWLTVSGVVAISGVAIRWLAVNTGDTIPYWLTLGGVGLALLLLGTILLLARERWIAMKDSTVSWWRRTATLRGVGIEWPVVLAPAAVAVIALAVVAIEDWVEPLTL